MAAIPWQAVFLFVVSIAILTYMNEPFTSLHYITIATKPHPVLQKIQDTARMHGEKVHVLDTTSNPMIALSLYLQTPTLRPNDVILFTDPYNVALVGSQREILQRYKQFHSPIVIGGAHVCSPDADRASQYTATRGTPFPYVNSGLLIGRVWALRTCMAVSANEMEDTERFWTNVYFKNRSLITIDTHAKLFLSCDGIQKKQILYDRFKRTLLYTETDTRPLILHAKGADKSHLYSVIGRWKESASPQ